MDLTTYNILLSVLVGVLASFITAAFQHQLTRIAEEKKIRDKVEEDLRAQRIKEKQKKDDDAEKLRGELLRKDDEKKLLSEFIKLFGQRYLLESRSSRRKLTKDEYDILIRVEKELWAKSNSPKAKWISLTVGLFSFVLFYLLSFK